MKGRAKGGREAEIIRFPESQREKLELFEPKSEREINAAIDIIKKSGSFRRLAAVRKRKGPDFLQNALEDWNRLKRDCGSYGDLAGLIMEVEHPNFFEAVREEVLERRVQLEKLKRNPPKDPQEHFKLAAKANKDAQYGLIALKAFGKHLGGSKMNPDSMKRRFKALEAHFEKKVFEIAEKSVLQLIERKQPKKKE